MTPNGAIPCKLDTHVVKLSSGANSSTHTGGYTNNGACDKPVKNLENINNPLLGTATNITSAIIFKKIDNSKTFLWLFHVVNKYPVSGHEHTNPTYTKLPSKPSSVSVISNSFFSAVKDAGTIPESKFMINCNKHKNTNKVLRVLISRCSCSIASCRIPFFSNTCCSQFIL